MASRADANEVCPARDVMERYGHEFPAKKDSHEQIAQGAEVGGEP